MLFGSCILFSRRRGLTRCALVTVVQTSALPIVEGRRNPWQPPVEGDRHLDEVVAWNRAVLEATTRELDAGRMPVMLGGDHCLAMGSIAAVAAHCRKHGRKLRILWLDAHTDFNTRDRKSTRLNSSH